MRFSARVGLLVFGAVSTAVSVGVTLWTGLGPGPLDVFIGAVRIRTGLPLGAAMWLVIGALIATAWILGRRPGPGTIIAPVLIGPVMQATVEILGTVAVPDQVIVQLAIHLVAVLGIGLGAGALIVSGLGAGSGELLATAASHRSGRAEARVRMAFESTWLVLGVVLGGPIGLGTVVVAVTIGPSVASGYRLVSRVAVPRPTVSSPDDETHVEMFAEPLAI